MSVFLCVPVSMCQEDLRHNAGSVSDRQVKRVCGFVYIQHSASSVAISSLRVLLQELSQKEFNLWSS